MRSWYKELGLELVKPLEDLHCRPRRPPMVEEKREEREGDHIKLFLMEFPAKQRNEMMDNFYQILQWLSTTTDAYSTSSHFGGTTPFKVHVNFYIPIFEGQIDVDDLEKWLKLLEGYFYVHIFSNKEKITFALLKVIPHVKHWWENYCEHNSIESRIFGVTPTWDSFITTTY
jgi:hypothetical protein